MGLYAEITSLVEACRKHFGGTSKPIIDDMIKLITQPAFPSGTEILGRTKFGISDHQFDIPLTLEAVPPVISKPLTVFGSGYLMVANAKLIFNKSDGTQLSLAIPEIHTNYTVGKYWVETSSVTIPTNTSIVNNKAILRIDEYNSVAVIEKIIATY